MAEVPISTSPQQCSLALALCSAIQYGMLAGKPVACSDQSSGSLPNSLKAKVIQSDESDPENAEKSEVQEATTADARILRPTPPSAPRSDRKFGRRKVVQESTEKDAAEDQFNELAATLPPGRLCTASLNSESKASVASRRPKALDDCALDSPRRSSDPFPENSSEYDPSLPLYSTWAGTLEEASNSTESPCRFRRRVRPLINKKALLNRQKSGSVYDSYTWKASDQLGKGAFGTVFRGRHKYDSKRMVAVKQISRNAVDDIDALWSEMGILGDLDHPNVLRFLEAYEDSKYVYIVTEVCLGGSLEHWVGKMAGNIEFAVRIAREVTGVLAHCHSHGICHRDLKLENILLLRKSSDSPVRVADFGLAKRCSKRVVTQRMSWAAARSPTARNSPRKPSKGAVGIRFQSVKGTPDYMAPEILQVLHAQISSPKDEHVSRSLFYDFKCDVWSLGVVVYSLLVGGRPYSLQEITEFVVESKSLPDLSAITTAGPDKGLAPSVLHSTCPATWDFLMKCLTPDFNARPSSSELLKHDWIQLHSPTTPGTALELKGRLRNFAVLPEFKKVALLAASRHLSAYEHEEIRALFQRIDVNNKGVVTMDELKEAFSAGPPSTPGAPNCEDLLGALDSDRSGEITYTEFLAAVMDHRLEDREDLARAAFNSFDQDGDGSISKAELEFVLNSGNVKEILMLGDKDLDGEISFEEFLNLLKRS